jgi:hypothetical protein
MRDGPAMARGDDLSDGIPSRSSFQIETEPNVLRMDARIASLTLRDFTHMRTPIILAPGEGACDL